MKLNSNEYNFNKTNYQFNLNSKISFPKKSNKNKNINNKEDKLFKTGCTNTNTNMNSFYKLYKPVRLKKEFDLKKKYAQK